MAQRRVGAVIAGEERGRLKERVLQLLARGDGALLVDLLDIARDDRVPEAIGGAGELLGDARIDRRISRDRA
jgi:hypothetical protein